jgi:hypothetical protein
MPQAIHRSDRLAKLVTEAGSPAIVVVLLPLAVAWQATGHDIGRTVLWGLVVALFSSVLPMVFIVYGARRGRWDGHHVRNREGRLLPMLACLACTLAGLSILWFWRAPSDVLALNIAMVTTLLVCIAITQFWKVSLHCTVASGAVATLVLLYGPWLLVLVPVVLLIGWARVRITDHTVAQVLVGLVLGPLLGGPIFLLVR